MRSQDKDDDGSLSATELMDALTREGGGAALSRSEAEQIIREFDTNDDGVLQYEEFAVMWAAATSRGFEKKSGKSAEAKSGKSAEAKAAGAKAGGAKAGGAKADGRAARAGARMGGGAPASSSSSRAGGAPTFVSSFAPTAESGILSVEALERAAENELDGARRFEERADGLMGETFERRIGHALLQSRHAAGLAARGGGHGGGGAVGRGGGGGGQQMESIRELMRAWDLNGDGELNRVELRQAVRADLDPSATNVEIDALFRSFDADGSGKLDLTELQPCLTALADAATAAALEIPKVRAIADGCRDRASQLQEAAAMMRDVEQRERQLREEAAALPLGVRLAESLARRSLLRLEPLVDEFKGVDPSGRVGIRAFRGGVLALCTGDPELPTPTDEEIDAWFDAEALVTGGSKQCAKPSDAGGSSQLASGGKPAGAAGASGRHAGGGAVAGGSRAEMRSVEVLEVLKNGRVAFSRAREAHAERERELQRARKAAKALQANIKAEAERGANAAREQQLEAQRARLEQERAEEAARRAKEQSRMKRLERKAKSHAEFEARVAEKRRQSQEALTIIHGSGGPPGMQAL